MKYFQHALIKDNTLKLPNLYRFTSSKVKPQELSEFLLSGGKIVRPSNNWNKVTSHITTDSRIAENELKIRALELYLARHKDKSTLCNSDYSRVS